MKYERGSFITVASRDTLRGMHPTAQALYMWLSSYANETGDCFPSRKTLANDCGCSEDSVDKMISVLLEAGLLEKRKRIANGEYQSNMYRVLIVGGSRSQRGPWPLTAGTVAARNGINSNQLTQTNEEGGSEDGTRAAKVYEPEEGTSTKSTRLAKGEQEKLQPLVRWAERERGFPFLSTEQGKQLKALSLAKQNGIKAAELRERWEEMSSDKFWSEKGYDWMNVVKSFNTKRA